MGEQEIVSKKQKGKKVAAYIINIISIIIMLFAVFVVITSLASKDKGYTSYFGNAYVLVKSDSMAADLTKPDNFQKGDVIVFKVLSEDQKLGLEEGTVITFWDNNISSTRELNTHRIYAVRDIDGDGIAEYSTKGDNNPTYDKGADDQQIWRKASDVQGVYVGKSAVVGHILTYLQSSTGFAIFIVVPCVLVMIYCIVLVVLNLIRYTRAKTVMQHEDDVDALKAEIKAQLLKEMEEQKNKTNDNKLNDDEIKEEENQANDSAEEQNSDADATQEDK